MWSQAPTTSEKTPRREAFFDLGLRGEVARSEADVPLDVDLEAFLVKFEADITPNGWLYGSAVGDYPNRPPHFLQYSCMQKFLHYWAHDRDDSAFTDVIEVCGGTARTSQMLIRRWRRVRVGHNFDAVVGINLLDGAQVHAMWTYITRTKPLVAVIATPLQVWPDGLP